MFKALTRLAISLVLVLTTTMSDAVISSARFAPVTVGGGGGGGFPATGQIAYYDNFDDSVTSTNLDGQTLTSGGGMWDTFSATILKEGATAGKVTTPSGTNDYFYITGTTNTITNWNYALAIDYFPNGATSTKFLELVTHWDTSVDSYWNLNIAFNGTYTINRDVSGANFATIGSGSVPSWNNTQTHTYEIRVTSITSTSCSVTAWIDGVQFSTNVVDNIPMIQGTSFGAGIRNSGVQVDNIYMKGL